MKAIYLNKGGMMLSRLLVIFLASCSSSLLAFSNESYFLDSNRTIDYYQKLKEMYASASSVTDDQLLGFHTGRCFQKTSPSKAIAGALHIKRELEDVNVGPIGEDRYVYRGASIWERRRAATHYDELSSEELLAIFNKNNTYFIGTHKDLEFRLPLSTENLSFATLRISGDYVIELDYLDDNTDLDNPDVACYYFKRH